MSSAMQTNEAILVVLLVVLIFAVASRGFSRGQCPPGCGCSSCQKSAFSAKNSTVISPYTPLHHQVAAFSGAKHDAHNQRHHYMNNQGFAKAIPEWTATPRDIEREHTSDWHSKRIEAAQQEAWTPATGSTEGFNPEPSYDPAFATTQHFEPTPSIDYQTALVDIVASPKMCETQKKWAQEVAPYSGRARVVDDLDEAVTLSHANQHGLRLGYHERGGVQGNGPQLLEVDSASAAPHGRSTFFQFNG